MTTRWQHWHTTSFFYSSSLFIAPSILHFLTMNTWVGMLLLSLLSLLYFHFSLYLGRHVASLSLLEFFFFMFFLSFVLFNSFICRCLFFSSQLFSAESFYFLYFHFSLLHFLPFVPLIWHKFYKIILLVKLLA